jgi:O-antigen/teichoic acid export membrane protein
VFARLSALFRNLVIYGLGDVGNNIVGFLLLPLYVHFLTISDYGALGLLLTVETVTKLAFRWGVDGSFMRLYYDCETDRDRQRLASTIFWFLAVVDGALLVVALALLPFYATRIFGVSGYELPLALLLVNTYVIGFNFLPFHVMRIQGQTRRFAALTTTKTTVTMVARIILIVGFRQGVLGFVIADLVTTALLMAALTPWYRPLLRPMFSRAVLRDALEYGLPRVPHGIANQLMVVGDRWILRLFSGLASVGLYTVGASFGMALKLFLSAFEYAWQPFYFETMKRPDAKRTFRLVTTYGIAVLVLLEAGLAAIAQDIVRLMTKPDMYGAAAFIPWIGLGVVFQGVYLLTSIGLNITKSTKLYPVATAIAATVSLIGNLLLVPSFGAIGAAWSNAIAFATLAGVAMRLSQRVYPMTYEYGRIARLAIAGIGAYALTLLIPASWPAWLGFLTRGTLVCVTYPALLFVLGFYHSDETAFVMGIIDRLRKRPAAAAAGGARREAPPSLPHEPSVEAAGAIVDVPLAQEELPVADARDARDSADEPSPSPAMIAKR